MRHTWAQVRGLQSAEKGRSENKKKSRLERDGVPRLLEAMKRIEDDDFYYYGIGDPDETVKKRRRGRKKGAAKAPPAPTPTLDCDADEIVVSTETLWETPMSVLELAGK